MGADKVQLVVFTMLFLGLTLSAALYAYCAGRSLVWWLRAEAAVTGAAVVYLSSIVFQPMVSARPSATTSPATLVLPAYDDAPWRAWPVQVGGRTKPLETAAVETLREITGRARFRGQSAVPIVLQWMLSPSGDDVDGPFVNWEQEPFILCDHQGLRAQIYAHLARAGRPLTDEERHGRYVAPADLRSSPDLKRLVDEAALLRRQDRDKAGQRMSPEQRKAEEVSQRLATFDSITGRPFGPPGMVRRHEDPFHIVALDPVPTGAWFSAGELRDLKGKAARWNEVMFERLKLAPQLYLAPEHRAALEAFQARVQAGRGLEAIGELEPVLHRQSALKMERLQILRAQTGKSGDTGAAMTALLDIARTPEEEKRLIAVIHQGGDVQRELQAILDEHDRKLLDELRDRVRSAQRDGYRPDKLEYRMLHINYLEDRFPDLYREAAVSRALPSDEIDAVLAARGRLVDAYRSGDTQQFATATADFLGTVRKASERIGPYPGTDTPESRLAGLMSGRPATNPATSLLALEMTYNRVDPFTCAWVVMLGSVLLFVLSAALAWRPVYVLAFAAYLAALGFEAFGFYARIILSGRPPVTNLYETLIWVSFMSAVFALVLELIYRRRVIGLTGAAVSALTLILAAQLPVDMGVRIKPIEPVLRTNYWLTVHVLTIVSSYAAGTLAWGMGNLTLALLVFSRPQPELLKTLSRFTYRAVQIAVLLLAAGTFLGGWWAAESWGRFWGWDPKEVWALIALVCYVIPLHARYIGWVKDFGLAVAAVVCFGAIVMSWYGVNFVLAAGLHSYGFGSGGPWLAFWCGLVNLEWVLVASIIYWQRMRTPTSELPSRPPLEMASVS